MPEQNGNTRVIIGNNIRRLRKKKGYTLNNLSERSGLSTSMLSQIENARVNVNLNTLTEICNALDYPLVSLFGEEMSTNVRLIRRENRQWYPLAGRSMESILINSKSNIEFSIIVLPPGENTGQSNHHPGEEFCYVIKGSIRTILNNETTYELGESDLIYYESNISHRWENNSNETAEFIVINSPATY
jgi:transcriptional regulator with XRE-family HTH domain